ncbi:TPA: hypothetical protein ACXM9H_002598, partial [Burkholderia multivorans]
FIEPVVFAAGRHSMQFVNERIRNIPGLVVMAYCYLYEQWKKERKRGRFHKGQARGLITFVAFFQFLNCDVEPPLSSKKIIDGTRLDPRPVCDRPSIREKVVFKDRKIKTHLGSMLTVVEQTQPSIAASSLISPVTVTPASPLCFLHSASVRSTLSSVACLLSR